MVSFAYGLAGVVLFTILAPVIQAIARQTRAPIAPVTILAAVAVISHLCSISLGIMTLPQFQYWNAASMFGFGVMLYVFAFGAVYKSVSLEILLDIAQRPGHSAPLADIVDNKVRAIFRGRTEILVGDGQVERTGQYFVATAAGRASANRIGQLRRLFKIGNTGLYDFVAPSGAADSGRES